MSNQETIGITVHVNKQLADKIKYIAKFDGISRNKEYEQMIREWVHAFEDVYGEIDLKGRVAKL